MRQKEATSKGSFVLRSGLCTSRGIQEIRRLQIDDAPKPTNKVSPFKD